MTWSPPTVSVDKLELEMVVRELREVVDEPLWSFGGAFTISPGNLSDVRRRIRDTADRLERMTRA